MKKFFGALYTPFYLIYFGTFAIISLLFFFPANICDLFRARKAGAILGNGAARFLSNLFILGLCPRIKIKGKENLKNLPKKICVIANHQSIYDIPILVSVVPRVVGFIAKRELFKIPVLSMWLKSLRSVGIDRKSPRDSIKAIQQGIANIEGGHSMVIFPEGTRSRCNAQRQFKSGSFKLAYKSKAAILPVTLDGAYRLFEEKKVFMPFQKVIITIHPFVETENLSEEQQKELPQILCNQINSAKEIVETELLPEKSF